MIHEPNGAQALSVASAEVKGIDVSGLSPINVKIADISIASPNVKVIREKDNSINLMTLAEPGKSLRPPLLPRWKRRQPKPLRLHQLRLAGKSAGSA